MIIDLLGLFIFNFCTIIGIYFYNEKKINFRDKKIWLGFGFLDLVISLLLIFDLESVIFIAKIIGVLIVSYFIIKLNILKSLLTTFIFSILNLIIELIILALFILGLRITSFTQISECIEYINNSSIVSLFINIFSALLIILILKNKYMIKMYNKIINLFYKIKFNRLILISIIIFLVIAATYSIMILSNNLILIVIMFMIFLALILFILTKDINIRNQYEKTKEKYSSVKESLLEYEDMIDKYRVNNHENKNQLLIIQNMIKNKDKKINEYIDNLVGNVYMTNEKIMMDVSIIPAGGLRATIHSKLNIMDNKKIKYILNIDRKLRTIDFDNIDSDLNLKICKIVSIFIDNAIDEVDTHKTDKVVNIEMYVDNNKLLLEVSNKFKNNFDIERIYEQKYTTKEDGHGYGLALAKELIDSENKLKNNHKIEDDLFTQILEIKIK